MAHNKNNPGHRWSHLMAIGESRERTRAPVVMDLGLCEQLSNQVLPGTTCRGLQHAVLLFEPS